MTPFSLVSLSSILRVGTVAAEIGQIGITITSFQIAVSME